jgi:8-oxo-dGTP diphosphatase
MEIKIMASAIIIKDGKLLLLRRSKGEKFLSGYWTIVGGKFEEKDLTLEEAVKREVKEETNLDITVIKPIDVGSYWRTDKPGLREVEIAYLCVPSMVNNIILNPQEHDSFVWVDRLINVNPVTDFTKEKIRNIFKIINNT